MICTWSLLRNVSYYLAFKTTELPICPLNEFPARAILKIHMYHWCIYALSVLWNQVISIARSCKIFVIHAGISNLRCKEKTIRICALHLLSLVAADESTPTQTHETDRIRSINVRGKLNKRKLKLYLPKLYTPSGLSESLYKLLTFCDLSIRLHCVSPCSIYSNSPSGNWVFPKFITVNPQPVHESEKMSTHHLNLFVSFLWREISQFCEESGSAIDINSQSPLTVSLHFNNVAPTDNNSCARSSRRKAKPQVTIRPGKPNLPSG